MKDFEAREISAAHLKGAPHLFCIDGEQKAKIKAGNCRTPRRHIGPGLMRLRANRGQ